MKKVIIASSILSICLILIQTALFSHIPFFLITADLTLVYITFVAINNGSSFAMVLGFLSGLLLDFMSIAPLGLSSFIFVFLTFFLGKLHGRYNLNHFIFPFILTIVATFTKVLLLTVLIFFFGNVIKTYNLYEYPIWLELVLNLTFAPLLFFLLNHFPKLFKTVARKEIE